MMKKLGSARFALILILLTAILVISATFIESHSGSHGLAERFIYHTLLFKALLAGFFINILFSTFTRWPFKTKHIPFLITHLGLLMVILGVFVKQQFGVQGIIKLVEGEATNEMTIKDELALNIENRSGEVRQYAIDSIPFKVKQLEPHSKESFPSWIHDGSLHLIGHPPLQLPVDQPLLLDGRTIHTYARETPLTSAILWGEKPFLYFHKNGESGVLMHGNGFGTVETQALTDKMPNTYAVYDRGFQGYTAFYELKFATSPDSYLEALIEKHADELSPPLALLKATCEKASVPFGETAIEVLKTCYSQKPHWIDPLIDWKSLSEVDLNVLRWARNLLNEMPPDGNISEHLRQIDWPFADQVQNTHDFFYQLYSIKEDLPQLKGNERLLPVYLRLYELDYRAIALEAPKETAFTLEIESPLHRKLLIMKEEKQLENNKPALIVDIAGKELSIPFESAVKTPITENLLASLEYKKLLLPFEVRLHQAKDIKYPGSEQTESFECCLTVEGKKLNVSMNNVHETKSGYRLYLSGMTAIDTNDVRAVQLAVNRDPAKYLLTYPGALLIAMGILGLFFYKKGHR